MTRKERRRINQMNHQTLWSPSAQMERWARKNGVWGTAQDCEDGYLPPDVIALIKRTPKHERPRCGAKCRDGHSCKAPVVWLHGKPEPRKRCRMHGGLSTGPRTPDGKRRSLEALARGREISARNRAAGKQRRINTQSHSGESDAAIPP